MPLAWEEPANGFFHSFPRWLFLYDLSAHLWFLLWVLSLRPAPIPRVLLSCHKLEVIIKGSRCQGYSRYSICFESSESRARLLTRDHDQEINQHSDFRGNMINQFPYGPHSIERRSIGTFQCSNMLCWLSSVSKYIVLEAVRSTTSFFEVEAFFNRENIVAEALQKTTCVHDFKAWTASDRILVQGMVDWIKVSSVVDCGKVKDPNQLINFIYSKSNIIYLKSSVRTTLIKTKSGTRPLHKRHRS